MNFSAKLHKFFPRKKKKKKEIKRYFQKYMFASAPKSEPSNIFLTFSFLLLGLIFPASELTDAVCMWAVFFEELNG